MGKVPVWVGVPESVPLAARVRPAGRVPLLSEKVTAGTPPDWVKVALKGVFAVPVLVTGFCTVMLLPQITVRVKGCPFEPLELVAVKLMLYVPGVPGAGVPASVPVPLPLSVKVTPFGNAPVLLSDGVGQPSACPVTSPCPPTVAPRRS